MRKDEMRRDEMSGGWVGGGTCTGASSFTYIAQDQGILSHHDRHIFLTRSFGWMREVLCSVNELWYKLFSIF